MQKSGYAGEHRCAACVGGAAVGGGGCGVGVGGAASARIAWVGVAVGSGVGEGVGVAVGSAVGVAVGEGGSGVGVARSSGICGHGIAGAVRAACCSAGPHASAMNATAANPRSSAIFLTPGDFTQKQMNWLRVAHPRYRPASSCTTGPNASMAGSNTAM